MLSMSFLYLYLLYLLEFMILFVKYITIYELEVKENSIVLCFGLCMMILCGITIEDASSTCTFLIDTFSDYITIFHSLPHSFY